MVIAPNTVKYAFRIRTRTGMVVENLSIHGRQEADAQRKLLKMYPHCQVLECRPHVGRVKPDATTLADVVALATK
jgi:hypothetical protein